jgi:LacI family transcriptional regulator
MSRVTVHDVADAAGVSLATVDRVLNNRKGVRAETVDRVRNAMTRLNYVRDQTAANLARGRTYSFTFIVPTGGNSFMRQLEREIERATPAAAQERINISVVTVPPFEPEPLARTLDRLGLDRGDGLAVVATESQIIRRKIDNLIARGVHVVTLISDIPNSDRTHYVGIDNVAAGRVGASLLGRFVGDRRGKIAVVAGSMVLRDHVERRRGFEQVMRAEFPHLELLPTVEGYDDARTVELALTALLRKRSDIVGVYSLGAGTRGLVAALESVDRQKTKAIAHELTDHSRKALAAGTLDAVVAQDSAREVRSAIRLLKASVDSEPIVDSRERIPIEIFMRDNLH